MASKRGSAGKHRAKKGKIRQFGASASERREAQRRIQAGIARKREDDARWASDQAENASAASTAGKSGRQGKPAGPVTNRG